MAALTSRKSAIEEKMSWNWKVTLPSALIFAAKNVWTINFTTGFFYLYLYLKPLETVGCVVKNAQFPFLWTNVTCPSRNSSRWSTLLNQLRQRSFWTNFPHITGLFLQLKMVGLINLALLFRYREFPNVSSLFQYALFQRMWRQANASNTFSLAALCQGKSLR